MVRNAILSNTYIGNTPAETRLEGIPKAINKASG
jgi:hypothetical protein